MPCSYEIQVKCSDTCSNMVKAIVPEDLNLDPETCEEITRAVRNHGGEVTLSAAELKRNSHLFNESEVKDAEEEGGYQLNIHVPECSACGSDQ